MTGEELCSASATDLTARLERGDVTSEHLVGQVLARIERLNGTLNAYVTLDPAGALEAARAADRERRSGKPLPPLHGLPVSVKDNIMTAGLRSTSGSPLFHDHVPDEDSGVVAAARTAGAIVIGKTNTPAFGWTGTTDNKLFGPTPNPHDRSRTAGGSSGGAAVAAAAGLGPLHIGTDGGGSLRTPAAFTGTVGFKPSHGRIPDVPPHTHWLIQHYGPVARTVGDVALFMQATAFPDPRDPYSLPRGGTDYLAAVRPSARKPKAVFTTQLGWTERVDPEVERLCRETVEALREAGWTIVERDLAWPNPSPFADVIAGCGLAHRLRGFEDRRDDIEEGIQAILARVAALPPMAFYEAYLARNAWCAHPLSLFEETDLLLTPTSATLPFALGRLAPETIGGEAVSPRAWSPFLRAFNLTGQPAISVPAGRSRTGLPVGIQIVGSPQGDEAVLAAAADIERVRPWPTLWDPSDMKGSG